MVLQDEILINKFGQGFLISQSKPRTEDIEVSITASKLKPTFTPCVLLRKGVAYYNLKKNTKQPEGELEKSFVLLLSLFRISYQRRFESEGDD